MIPRNMFEPIDADQRERREQIQNFGAGERFLDQYFKYECMNLALEAVAEVIDNHMTREEDSGMSQDEKERITESLSKTLEGKLATESVDDELIDQIIIGVQGQPEKLEKPTAWEIFQDIACEAVGIDESTEKPTQDQLEDYRNVLTQMTHAIGVLANGEKGYEMAMESVNSEDGDQMLRTCNYVHDMLLHNGLNDDEIAIEYAIQAPTVADVDENGNIAIEKVELKWVGGKKTVIKKRPKKLRGAALAKMKKAGKKVGKMVKSAAEIAKAVISRKKRKKAGK